MQKSELPLLYEVEDLRCSTMTESSDIVKVVDVLLPHPIKYTPVRGNEERFCLAANKYRKETRRIRMYNKNEDKPHIHTHMHKRTNILAYTHIQYIHTYTYTHTQTHTYAP